ncbi:unnamed protein product [Onchocerca flexuosa]|uniref:CACTA en-spm transposon protein n=1 Tax=Onchocerca flexuosa TaxID=387005 RepID=A0A183HQT4_9BILA|nr:unnamed protein product [Onchocerca flexuosa]
MSPVACRCHFMTFEKYFSDFMGDLMDQIDGKNNGDMLDMAANAESVEVDLISKDWDWDSGEDNVLPHLDSDTIANVLQ